MQKYTVVIYAEAESLEEAQTNAQRMVDNYEGAGWFDLEVVVPR